MVLFTRERESEQELCSWVTKGQTGKKKMNKGGKSVLSARCSLALLPRTSQKLSEKLVYVEQVSDPPNPYQILKYWGGSSRQKV